MVKKVKVEEKAQFEPRGYDDTFDMTANDLETLSTQIRKDLAEAEEDKSEWLTDRISDINAYFGIKKASDWPFKGAAKISSKIHQVMVDTTAGNLVASAIAPENIIGVKTSKSKSIENAKYIEDFHNQLARFEYHFHDLIDRAWHNALIESYVVLKPLYQWEVLETNHTITRWIKAEYKTDGLKYDSATDSVLSPDGQVIPSLDINRIPEDPAELKSLGMHECTLDITTEHAKEGIKVLSISGADIFLPVSSPGETPYEKYQRAPFVIHHEYKTLQEMKSLQEQGKIKNFELLGSSLSQTIFAEELKHIKQQQAGQLDIQKHERYLTRNLWWYGKYEYKGRLRELVVYMNAETGVVLKVQVNQFGIRPFFPQIPFPIEGTTGGESLPKRIRSLVTELELVINTLINMGLIKAYPPKFFDPSSGFDPKTLGNIGPNAYVPVRDPSRNVFMPPQPEDPRVLMEMAKFLMDLIERASANSDAVQGQTSGVANTTAFEVQQALVRSGVRFDIIYRRLKIQLEPMFDYIDMLILRFMPLEKEVQMMGEQAVIQGEDGSQTSRLHAIHQQEGAHGLTLTGNSITSEQIEAQKAEKLFTMFGQDPYLSYKPESAYYLRFNLVKHYNPVMMDKLLATPQEVAELLRDRQKVQNEQEQAALEDAQGSNAEAQKLQMEMQMKAQEQQINLQAKQQAAQIDAEAKMQDMKLKEREHEQKMKQLEEAHRLKLELMKKESDAKAKEAAKRPTTPKS